MTWAGKACAMGLFSAVARGLGLINIEERSEKWLEAALEEDDRSYKVRHDVAFFAMRGAYLNQYQKVGINWGFIFNHINTFKILLFSIF